TPRMSVSALRTLRAARSSSIPERSRREPNPMARPASRGRLSYFDFRQPAALRRRRGGQQYARSRIERIAHGHISVFVTRIVDHDIATRHRQLDAHADVVAAAM